MRLGYSRADKAVITNISGICREQGVCSIKSVVIVKKLLAYGANCSHNMEIIYEEDGTVQSFYDLAEGRMVSSEDEDEDIGETLFFKDDMIVHENVGNHGLKLFKKKCHEV